MTSIPPSSGMSFPFELHEHVSGPGDDGVGTGVVTGREHLSIGARREQSWLQVMVLTQLPGTISIVDCPRNKLLPDEVVHEHGVVLTVNFVVISVVLIVGVVVEVLVVVWRQSIGSDKTVHDLTGDEEQKIGWVQSEDTWRRVEAPAFKINPGPRQKHVCHGASRTSVVVLLPAIDVEEAIMDDGAFVAVASNEEVLVTDVIVDTSVGCVVVVAVVLVPVIVLFIVVVFPTVVLLIVVLGRVVVSVVLLVVDIPSVVF